MHGAVGRNLLQSRKMFLMILKDVQVITVRVCVCVCACVCVRA